MGLFLQVLLCPKCAWTLFYRSLLIRIGLLYSFLSCVLASSFAGFVQCLVVSARWVSFIGLFDTYRSLLHSYRSLIYICFDFVGLFSQVLLSVLSSVCVEGWKTVKVTNEHRSMCMKRDLYV